MKPLVVIPARLAATRLPDKPLALIAGVPMIVHVWRRAVAAGIGPVVVACGDAPIAAAVEAAGGVAVMTDPALPSGSDRVHAAAMLVDAAGAHDVVVNVQGDLPAVEPTTVGEALTPVRAGFDIGTVVAPVRDAAEAVSLAVVKAACVFGPGEAVAAAPYFSRAPVPSGEGPLWHHIGIYAWRRPALARFVRLPPSALELREKLEQLRAIEAGLRIGAARVGVAPFGVDTPDDLARARAVLEAR